MMTKKVQIVKGGLGLVLLGLAFGVGMGIVFGINEDVFKDYIAQGIAANPEVHDAKSAGKIWRYAQRAHFHATGIAGFSLGLLILIMISEMKSGYKKASSIFLGFGSLYPLSWMAMFILAPSIGPGPAHDHFLTETFAYTGVGGLLIGGSLLCANLFLGFFCDETPLKPELDPHSLQSPTKRLKVSIETNHEPRELHPSKERTTSHYIEKDRKT